MKSRKFLSILVLFQIITILFLLNKLKDKINSHNTDVVTIKKENIVLNSKNPNTSCYEFVASKDINPTESWLTRKITYSINLDGLNEDDNYLIQKQRNVFRIVTLGDSFTFGQYVNTKENWTELLEKKLNIYLAKLTSSCNKIEIINLGVPGYDIDCAAERYKSKGLKYNPDLILWYIKSDDLQQIRKLSSPLRDDYILSLKKDQQYDQLIATGTITLNSQVVDIWNRFVKKNNINSVDYQINILQAFAQTYKTKTTLFNFNNFNSLEKRKIKDIVSKNSDYFSFFDNGNQHNFNSPNYTNLPYDSHFNSNGNVVVADDLFNYLIKNISIQCK